jgi:hypothetical protein
LCALHNDDESGGESARRELAISFTALQQSRPQATPQTTDRGRFLSETLVRSEWAAAPWKSHSNDLGRAARACRHSYSTATAVTLDRGALSRSHTALFGPWSHREPGSGPWVSGGGVPTISGVTASGGVAAMPRPRLTWQRMSRFALPAGWSLARRYLIVNLIVMLGAVLITGAWVGHQIEDSVLQRTAGITALYVDSVIGPRLQALAEEDRWLSPADTAALDRLVAQAWSGRGPVQDLVARWPRAVFTRPELDRSAVSGRWRTGARRPGRGERRYE